ncbi:MAG: HD domain-containing protein [Actinobacteria bacterium]|nr:MAG: HD domain-containing protein [Actinomycetota bacterium]
MEGLLRRNRVEREKLEAELLAPSATLSTQSKGRARAEEPDEFRTAFERDRDRVIHTKAFRRLKHKTQVFLNPDGDHFVTRMTHTIHVTQVGRSLAKALGLNEALTEAICLAHDVGHSPFGHTGEDALTPLVEGEWLHSAHGVRTLSILEPQNLSYEVLDGVRAHSWKIDPPPETPEGWICRFADRIAYLTHDVSDALRAGVLTYHDIPQQALTTFGSTSREWIDSLVTAVIEESHRTGRVEMEPRHLEVMDQLRDFMFEHVYLGPYAEKQKGRAIQVIQDLVGYYRDHPDEVPESSAAPGTDPLTAAVDYVAGMSDRFALRTWDKLFRPKLDF